MKQLKGEVMPQCSFKFYCSLQYKKCNFFEKTIEDYFRSESVCKFINMTNKTCTNENCQKEYLRRILNENS